MCGPIARVLSFLILVPCASGQSAASEPPAIGGPPFEALREFETYVRLTESRIDAIVRDKDGFLWGDTPEKRTKLRQAGVICEPRQKTGDVKVVRGLIHDWIGAAFIPGTRVGQVLAALQDYDNHKTVYRPDVVSSQILERNGDDFVVRLRLFKRKIVTVVLDTDYTIHYERLTGRDWRSSAYSTRIVEIAGAGGPRERARPPSGDHGYLWRLNSYWLLRERDGGVYVECEAVSLSRGIPAPLAPMIRSIIKSLPKDTLLNTMRRTRERVLRLAEAAAPTPGGR